MKRSLFLNKRRASPYLIGERREPMDEIIKELKRLQDIYKEQAELNRNGNGKPDYWDGKASGITLAIEIIEAHTEVKP